MEINEKKARFTADEKAAVEEILNFRHNIKESQDYIADSLGISSEYIPETNELFIWCENINESLNLAAAKESITDALGESMVDIKFGIPNE